MEQSKQEPWYKHRWPWILMSGPFLAIIGCAITIWLAFDGADQPVTQGVEKVGPKVVNKP
jgi:hypothetical protein